jgi:MFS family permease
MAGTWAQTVGLGWLVLDLTGDPFILGLVVAAQYAPMMLFGLLGGIIADGLPKRRLLTGTAVAASAVTFLIFGLVISGLVEIWQIVVLAAALGLIQAIEVPTRQAFAIEMVGREDIANAIAINSAAVNAARIIGPAFAGILIGGFGVAIVFLLNAVSYLAVVASIMVMRAEELRPAPRIATPRSLRGVADSLAEGLGYIRRTDLILTAIATFAFVATFGMNFQVVIAPLARDHLGTDAAGFGFLMAAMGGGAIVAAVNLAIGGVRTSAIAVGALILGLANVVLAISPIFALSMVAMFVSGFGGITVAATVNTTMQLAVPDHLRGRVMSVFTTVFAGSVPIGGPILGGLASTLGIAAAVGFGGLVSLAAGVFAWTRIGRLPVAARIEASREAEANRSAATLPETASSGHEPQTLRPSSEGHRTAPAVAPPPGAAAGASPKA